MKIALAIFQLETLGGKERDCLAIATHLRQRGHDVSLVTTRAAPSLLPVVTLPRKGLSNHGRARDFAKAVMAYRNRHKPDLVLSFERVPGVDFYYAADAALALRMTGAKRFWPRARTYLQLERGVFENPRTRFFFLTQTQRDQYTAHYDFDSMRGTVLPVILHEERYEAARTAAERDVTRDQLGVPHDAVVALAVAVKPKQKGLDRSLNALARFPNLHLVSAGSTDPWISGQLKALKIEDRIHVLPYGANVMDLMAAADFLLHPARAEAAGQVIAESLLAGRPAIVSGVCGYAGDIVRSGAGIALHEPFDPQALIAAIITMLEQLPAMTRAAKIEADRLQHQRGRWLSVIAETIEGTARSAS
ncbi:Lipopolysaccharide core biosynthesis protein rfaG OS=Afipia felis OX=1035 GN=rfaG PE=3 SV=1 [Afipia felis]